MKTGIVTFAKRHGRDIGTIGSSIIRGKWIVENWPEAELWEEGMKTDALVFQKVYWEEMLDVYPGIKILDLCDPDWIKPHPEGFDVVRMSEKFDAITCSSEGLHGFLSKICKCPVYFVPDRVSLEFVGQPKQHQGRAKKVVWFGYSQNAKQVIPMILPSLARNDLSLVVVSNQDYNASNTYGVDIENRRHNWATLKWDIQYGDMVINPQPPQLKLFKFKSKNKTYLSWALGMPVAETAEDMEKFLDPDERQKEADKRRKEVEEKWDVKISVDQMKEIIQECAKRKETKNT